MSEDMRFADYPALVTIFLIVMICMIFVSSGQAQPELYVQVGSSSAYPNQQNVPISIYMDNYQDTVVGFNIWLHLDRPDIIEFQRDTVTAYDTSYWRCDSLEGPDCVDSTEVVDPDSANFIYVWIHDVERGNIDTTGTLVAGWEYVSATSLSGNGTDVNIVGLADYLGGPIHPGIGPQQDTTPLIRLLADVMDMDDTTINRSVNILIQEEFRDHFSFSAPNGVTIGMIDVEVIDTNFYLCTLMVGDECELYEQVSGSPYDSMFIDTFFVPILDTTAVIVVEGSLEVLHGLCGNINGNSPPAVDVSDLTYIVEYLFGGGPPPPNPVEADVNCSGGIDVADLTFMVEYLFGGGPAPCSTC